MAAHLENFPSMDEIKKEVEIIHNVKIGDVNAPLGRPSVASQEVDEGFNMAITYHRNAATLFTATSAFFARDNVALPGVALNFKVLAQVETNDSWMIIDFMSKRGAVVNFGPTAAPPSDWMTAKNESDVVVAFTKALAIFKVQYKKMNDHFLLAQKAGDAHAQVFIGNGLIAASEKIRVVSHYLTHLRKVANDKHAIKEFDRRLPFELEDYAMAASVESTVPSRLQIGTGLRAMMYQTHQFDNNKSAGDSMRARATFNTTL